MNKNLPKMDIVCLFYCTLGRGAKYHGIRIVALPQLIPQACSLLTKSLSPAEQMACMRDLSHATCTSASSSLDEGSISLYTSALNVTCLPSCLPNCNFLLVLLDTGSGMINLLSWGLSCATIHFSFRAAMGSGG